MFCFMKSTVCPVIFGYICVVGVLWKKYRTSGTFWVYMGVCVIFFTSTVRPVYVWEYCWYIYGVKSTACPVYFEYVAYVLF